MSLKLFEIMILREIFFKMIILYKSGEIDEDRIVFCMAWIFDFQMSGICEHRHDLLTDGLSIIAKIDAVT